MQALGEALLRAQQSLGALELDGETKGGARHRYASAEEVIRRCRDALHAAGLVLAPGARALQIQELGAARRGDEVVPLAPCVLVCAQYVLLHPASGESLALSGACAVSAGVDRNGEADTQRAAATGWTYSIRDVLRDLLLAPKGREQEIAGEPEPARRPTPAVQGRIRPDPMLDDGGAPLIEPAAPATPAPRGQLLQGGTAKAAAEQAERRFLVAAEQAERFSPPAPAAGGRLLPDMPALVAAGWSPEDAAELCLAPDNVEAPASAVIDVSKALLLGRSRRDAVAVWAAAGVQDPHAACAGEVAVTWGQVRLAAAQRRTAGLLPAKQEV